VLRLNMFSISSVTPRPMRPQHRGGSIEQALNGNADWLLSRYAIAMVRVPFVQPKVVATWAMKRSAELGPNRNSVESQRGEASDQVLDVGGEGRKTRRPCRYSGPAVIPNYIAKANRWINSSDGVANDVSTQGVVATRRR
jgi:hypothetical protein